jgi:hypothetical protein
MPRCYYYAIRLKDGIAQILTSREAEVARLTPENTRLLPERREIADTGLLGLEWVCAEGAFSQAAIAILAHATTGKLITRRYAQRFQSEVLAKRSVDGWILRADQVRLWVASQRRNEHLQQTRTLIEMR